ncbi:MAG: cation:proton antiporter [Candidatus Eisenbacteria bacterium]|nr:cation:proton antiporter [Candidatus Eisenbacteria bacterium]
MDFWAILFDVGALLAAALALGALCERLRQSALLGYLLAGALLGPNGLDIAATGEEITGLAEVGVALLLFSVGLEFSWKRLREMGPIALGGGTLQVVATGLLAAAAASALGVSPRGAIVLGGALALSSTAGVLRMLMTRAEVDSVHGRHALGILLLQDLAVIPLVLLSGVLTDSSHGGILPALGRSGLMLLAAMTLLYLLFNILAPRVLIATARIRNRELPVLFAMVAALASIWMAHEMGLSPALGAFVAGLLLAESPYAAQVRADLAVLRVLLVALFFGSVGMLSDPGWMVSHVRLIAWVVAAVVVGKAAIVWGVLRALRQTHFQSIAAGVCLAQIGEFSFVIAGPARGTVLTDDLFKMMAATMMATLFLTPYLVAGARPAASFVLGALRRVGLARSDAPPAESGLADSSGLVILVGYGPAGEAVGEALKKYGVRVLVLDLNTQLARKAQEDGFEARVGDATQVEVLDSLRVASACAIAVTVPDPLTAEKIVQAVRSRNDRALIVARARYHRYHAALEIAGADVVIDEEEHVGVSLGLHLVRSMRGAARMAARRSGSPSAAAECSPADRAP